MEISDLYSIYRENPSIITDSRQIRENTIFLALKGEKFDGNKFAKEALGKGARFVVVDDPAVVENEQYILVKDSLFTLQKLAAYHRNQLEIPLVAITGSNGKTTTKELCAGILSSRYIVSSTKGNLNNHIGVPLTLLEMDSGTEIGIVEMGANHGGEIQRLCEIARPDYGLITNVGHAHLEGFGSFEGVKMAKGELYRYLDGSGGLIFCNGNDKLLEEMLEGIETGIFYYGVEGSLCSGEVIGTDPGLSLNLMMREQSPAKVRTGLVGEYNLDNILAAVAIALHFRIPPDAIVAALQGWTSHNNRSQRIETQSNILIMDAYNANPTSMTAAIDTFRKQEHPDKVLILGDMLELGDSSREAHLKVVHQADQMDCKEVFLVGPVFNSLEDLPSKLKTFSDVDSLAEWLDEHPLEERLVLLKASRGIGLERLKEKL